MRTVAEILEAKASETHSIGPNATVRQALRTMAELDVGALVVRDGPRVAGLFSERDAARRVILGGFSPEVQVKEVMRIRYPTARRDDTVQHCMRLLTQRRSRHLLVLEGDTLHGVVSIGDLVWAAVEANERAAADLEAPIQPQRS